MLKAINRPTGTPLLLQASLVGVRKQAEVEAEVGDEVLVAGLAICRDAQNDAIQGVVLALQVAESYQRESDGKDKRGEASRLLA